MPAQRLNAHELQVKLLLGVGMDATLFSVYLLGKRNQDPHFYLFLRSIFSICSPLSKIPHTTDTNKKIATFSLFENDYTQSPSRAYNSSKPPQENTSQFQT
jgi:hypothetical protein